MLGDTKQSVSPESSVRRVLLLKKFIQYLSTALISSSYKELAWKFLVFSR